MIPKECKRLAEVDFPIAVVSRHSAREKSIRHGHPSTLHLWWARRPLAACRAVLLGLLLPDPCDPQCPEDFKNKARELLPKVQGKVGAKDEDLRQALLKFIGDFSNWDLSSNQTYLETGRGLVKAAHPGETPLVVDPFAGGGSIPLEALRLGCETFASDLNPVACLILKVMLEDIPRQGPELADELRRVGKEIKEAAEKELKQFYPDDPYDMISKEPNLLNVSDEMREEITKVLGQVTQYDRQLQQGAERFSAEYVKEIRIKLVPQSGGGIKTYHRDIQTTKKDEKEEEKVKQYVLLESI